ncbi:hypothetical protein [Actinacidiphila alni]|uniref:hypothetical protein n=1 Tax=Actinacidiphila alni TaxID=380248 RepID=UPI003453C777
MRLLSARRAAPLAAAAVVTALLAGTAASSPASATTSMTGSAPTPAPPAPGGRGALLGVTTLRTLDRAQAAAWLTDQGFGSPAARHGFTEYRVTYRTVGPAGRPTTASGVLALPDTGRRTPLAPVVYLHGTTVPKDAVASATGDNYDAAAGPMFAAAGYAGVAPDYLGLGSGPGPHPYMVHAAETTSALDLLTAARTLTAREDRRLAPGIRIAGFSQGAAAALDLGKTLREHPVRGTSVTAIGAVSGPYDVAGAELPAALDTDRLDGVEVSFYLAYLTVAWNHVYHLYDSPAEVFRGRYARLIPTVFDGAHDYTAIYRALPADVTDMLTPAYLARLRHPTGTLARALHTNDLTCTGWRPAAPVRLWAAHADGDVAFLNSEHCRAALHASGARPRLTDLGALDHQHTALTGLPAVLRWFERLDAARP